MNICSFSMNLIVAFNQHNVIGKDNTIPWYIPEDLKRFKQITNGHILVMGRKTFDSLPNGPLTNRIHIVITNQSELYNKNSEYVYYINYETSFSLIKNLQEKTQKEVFVIGGSTVYKQYFEYCTKFYITYVNNKIEGSVYFPYNIDYFQNSYEQIGHQSCETHEYYIFNKL
jgi:dihydrofolate reductase